MTFYLYHQSRHFPIINSPKCLIFYLCLTHFHFKMYSFNSLLRKEFFKFLIFLHQILQFHPSLLIKYLFFLIRIKTIYNQIFHQLLPYFLYIFYFQIFHHSIYKPPFTIFHFSFIHFHRTL